jgi:replicative DNA helicase
MQISDKDKALVHSLIQEKKEEAHFDHSYEIDKQIVAVLLTDRHFLVQCLSLLKPTYFGDLSHELICKIVFDFFGQYKQLPNKAYVQQELKERCKNKEHLFLHLGELEAILMSYVPGSLTRDYLMDKVCDFAKKQAIKIAVHQTIDLIKADKDPYGKIWDLWRSALTTEKSQDLGLDYFNTLDERYQRMQEELAGKEIFTSGFKGIDQMLTSKGLSRGEIGCFVGLSGAGKSIALINAAASNLLLSKKVLYITLEMSQDKIAKRFDSLLSNTEFKMLLQDQNIVKQAILEHVKHDEDTRQLIIKHYPGGSADINTFRAYVSQLGLYGFKPDLICVDYVGELKDIHGMKTYESRQLLVREMRAFGQEELHCTLTAIQANRKGREAQDFEGHIDDDAMADSFGQARPMDAIWSLNKPESGCNVGSLFAIKHRDGISRQEIHYKMNTGTLLMSEIPKEEMQMHLTNYRKAKAGNVEPKKIEIQ